MSLLALGDSAGPVVAGPGTITLGLDTFGEVSSGSTGDLLSAQTSIRNIVEEAVLADQVGLDHFAIGEHHIAEMPLSAPDVVLAAIASRTKRIRLGSAVTVLSTDDPVRVYQRYATLDAVSGGRAEVILGRGSSTEGFPLFGFDTADYEELFEEKLALFTELRKEQVFSWHGNTRAPLDGVQVHPRTTAGLPTWVGVGGSPNSVLRAARNDMHLMLAIIGGNPERFAPLAQLYQAANEQAGRKPGSIGVHSPGHVAPTDEQAAEEYWPHYRDFLPEAMAARGMKRPTRASFEAQIGPGGSLYIGSPDTVARKIVATMTVLEADRFALKYGVIGMKHDALLSAIDLFGTQVAPRVRAALAGRHQPGGQSAGPIDGGQLSDPRPPRPDRTATS